MGPPAPASPPAAEVDPGPNSSVAVTTHSNTMAATYGVAYLTGGQTVLIGADDFEKDESSGGAIDTDLQAAIVTGSSVNTVKVPLPAGATESSSYIGGAAVTALTNGNFAVLYWGSNESDGSGGAGANDDLPDYYVQIFAPNGSTVGGLITLANNGNEGNDTGSIAEDPANGGFVVAVNTDDQTEILVQRYTDAGAASGSAFTFAGLDPYSTAVDSRGDIVVLFENFGSGAPDYLFIPESATSDASAGVLPAVASPTGMAVAADPSGGFIGFETPATGTDLEEQTISTSGALSSTTALGSVGSAIAEGDYIWSVVSLSGGGYAMTLNPYDGNGVVGEPAVEQVITVGASLSPASTTVEDMTTIGGDPAPVGPYAVADASGGIATYTDIPGSGNYSSVGFPLEASLSAVAYLDAPQPNVSAGGTVTYTAGGSPVTLDPTVALTDPTGPTLARATVQIASGFRSGDHLSADTSGTSITATYEPATGVLELIGTDTLAHYEAVLDSIAYSFEPSNGDPTNGGTAITRTIEWTAYDETAASLPVTSTVDVQRRAQAPFFVVATDGTYGIPLSLITSGGSGGGAVSYAVTNGSASGCSVSGTTLTSTSAGSCLVTATKAGEGEYEAAKSLQTPVTFAKASQAILIVTSTSGTFGEPLTLTTSGGSGGGAVSFTASDETATGCSVSGTTLTATSAGTCRVTATKAGDVDFEATTSPQATVTFAKASQAILTVNPTGGTYGEPITLTAGGGSGTGAVSFSASNGTATGCTVSGIELTSTSAGTCLVTATKAGDEEFEPATSAQATVTIAKAAQAALTVTSISGTYGEPITLTTGGGSGTGAVLFTAINGTATECSVSGTELTATSAGTCRVTATKAGDGNFEAATSTQTTVTFAKKSQAALSVTSTKGTFGTPVKLNASGGSGTGAVSFTASNGTATECSVSGIELTATSAGTCEVIATRAADGDYEAVSSVPTTVTFGKASQTLAFTSAAPSGATVGGTYEPAAAASSGLPATIALDASSTGCALSSRVVHFTEPGLCVLDAEQAGDGSWLPATEATQTIKVEAAPTTPTTPSTPSPTTPTTPGPGKPASTRGPRQKQPTPTPKQQVTVRISGLKPGGTYFGNAPKPHCVAHANTGHVSCQISGQVTATAGGSTVTYTADARGSDGATATAQVTVHIAKLELGGLQPTHGVYVVKLGDEYTLRVASRTKPLYVTAAVAPQPPAGVHDWFHRAGSKHGIPVWTLRLFLHTYLSRFPVWNLGIKIGDKTHVVTIHT
jgi:hypothetical protein